MIFLKKRQKAAIFLGNCSLLLRNGLFGIFLDRRVAKSNYTLKAKVLFVFRAKILFFSQKANEKIARKRVCVLPRVACATAAEATATAAKSAAAPVATATAA